MPSKIKPSPEVPITPKKLPAPPSNTGTRTLVTNEETNLNTITSKAIDQGLFESKDESLWRELLTAQDWAWIHNTMKLVGVELTRQDERALKPGVLSKQRCLDIQQLMPDWIFQMPNGTTQTNGCEASCRRRPEIDADHVSCNWAARGSRVACAN